MIIYHFQRYLNQILPLTGMTGLVGLLEVVYGEVNIDLGCDQGFVS